MAMMIYAIILMACSAVAADLYARVIQSVSKAASHGTDVASNVNLAGGWTHDQLISTAAWFFSAALCALIIPLVLLMLSSTSTAESIVKSGCCCVLFFLYVSSVMVSGHVMKTTTFTMNCIGTCWQLLLVAAVTFPRESPEFIMGLSSLCCLPIAVAIMLMDFEKTLVLNLVSCSVRIGWHLSVSPPVSDQSAVNSTAALLISECFAFLWTTTVAYGLKLWTQHQLDVQDQVEHASFFEQALHRMLAALSDAQLWLDPDLGVVGPAAKFCDMISLTDKCLAGQNFSDFVCKDEKQRFCKFVSESAAVASKASPARAINLTMTSSSHEPVGIELFHVAFPGHTGCKKKHLIVVRDTGSCRAEPPSWVQEESKHGDSIGDLMPLAKPTACMTNLSKQFSDMSRSSVRELPELENIHLDLDVSSGKLMVKSFSLTFAEAGEIPCFKDFLSPSLRQPFAAWLASQASDTDGFPKDFTRKLDFRVPGTQYTQMTARQVRFLGMRREGDHSLFEEEGSSSTRTPDARGEPEMTHPSDGISNGGISELQRLLESAEDPEKFEELLAAHEESLEQRMAEVQTQMNALEEAASKPKYAKVELVKLMQCTTSFAKQTKHSP